MKLARFDAGAGPRLGLVREDTVIDLADAGIAYPSMLALIADGDAALAAIRAVSPTQGGHALADVRLLAPIERPGKYLAMA